MNFVTRRLAVATLALAPALLAAPVLAQTATRDFAQEEANRKLVIEFYDTVFNKHEVDKGAAVLVVVVLVVLHRGLRVRPLRRHRRGFSAAGI